jgi:glycerophosphoryl diester phosphodiesterase
MDGFRLIFLSVVLGICVSLRAEQPSGDTPINLQADRVYKTTTKSIAHRGGAVYAPENTLAAFRLASNKCDMVEIDVRVSSDGHLVVMHDATVNRTTDGTGNVNAKTLAQLKALDAGQRFSSYFTGEKIPTFAEAIQSILPYATPVIEHKAGTATSYVAAIQALGVASNVVVISFDTNFIAGVHALDPSIRLGVLGSGLLNSTNVMNILATGADIVLWNKIDVSTSGINLVRSLGAKLFVYTANGADIQTWVDMGVDGIVSDDPGLVRYLTDDQPSPNEAFAEELVSYWKFDDGLTEINSTNATDVEARNPGMLRGFGSPPTWTTGAQARVGGALYLDGVDDVVDIPQSASLDIGTNAVTISCWVKMGAKPSVIPESFGSVYASAEDSYILYQDKGNSELRFKVTTTNGNAARPGIHESNLSTGQWHHVVGLYNGNVGPVSGQASIYLDGKLKDVHTGNDSTVGLGLTQWIKAGQHAAIGQDGSDNQYRFSGSVDEVAIWRRTLSHGELLQLFQSGTSQVPLQKQVMSIHVTAFGAQSSVLYIDVLTQHASLTANDLALLRADRVSGPYSNVVNTSVHDLGGGLFRWAWSEDDVDRAFFKVVYP